MQNRRTFLGSAAAAGVGAAVGGSALFPTSLSYAQGHPVPDDPVMAELQKQLAETVIAIRKGRGKAGEHARRIAANVRLLNAYGLATAADVQLRRLLKQEGREALLAREIDPTMLAGELKVIGVERLPAFSATYADRALMIDTTATNGMAAALAAVAAGFDRIAPVLDRHATTTSVVAVRQDVDECWEWFVFLTSLESLSWEWCIIGMSLCWLFLAFYMAWATFMCSLGCLCVV